jgi:uncharacterized membrane protein YeaQ/YmgE (transglycosylase-associated protein family)
MSWLVAIIVGGLVGWIAGSIMRYRGSIWTDIIVGIVGAFLARWFFGDVLGIGVAAAAGTLSLWGIIWGVLGAVVLIAIVRAIMSATRTEQPGPSYHEEVERRRHNHDDRNL